MSMSSSSIRLRSSGWNSAFSRTDTSGCRRWNSVRRGISHCSANEGRQLTCKADAGRPSRSISCWMSPSARLTVACSCSPGRERQPALPPHEQRIAQPVFQLADLLADRALRQAHGLRRPGEAEMAARHVKAAQRASSVESKWTGMKRAGISQANGRIRNHRYSCTPPASTICACPFPCPRKMTVNLDPQLLAQLQSRTPLLWLNPAGAARCPTTRRPWIGSTTRSSAWRAARRCWPGCFPSWRMQPGRSSPA